MLHVVSPYQHQERHEPLTKLLKGPVDTWKMLTMKTTPPPEPATETTSPRKERKLELEAEATGVAVSPEVLRERQVAAAVEAGFNDSA